MSNEKRAGVSVGLLARSFSGLILAVEPESIGVRPSQAFERGGLTLSKNMKGLVNIFQKKAFCPILENRENKDR